MADTEYPQSAHGWASDFPRFSETPAIDIRQSLVDFLRNVSPEQLHAWDESIAPLQAEVDEVLSREPYASGYSAILEYQLPMEYRRPDVILLMGGAVLVLELKGKDAVDLADVDQASAYARDLRAYHRDCENRPVLPVLVLMRGSGRRESIAGVEITGSDALDAVVGDLLPAGSAYIDRQAFLDPDAYRPLPTIVEAARELMETGELRRIKRADAETRPTLEHLTAIAHEAAESNSRHLILLSGLPGTGKTLVGLQLAHARFLDDLAVDRGGSKPTAPAVYLSGNGPLVEVLQFELKQAGGGGKTFVRGVKAYVGQYSSSRSSVPPEHVLIFDEAQRAFDAAQVAAKQGAKGQGKSEPEHFIEFAERIPEWCVVVGLIGSGQEIHVGEEAGIEQWRKAIQGSPLASSWTVHLPPDMLPAFDGLERVRVEPTLHLTAELRYHLAENVHRLVRGLLDNQPTETLADLTKRLEAAGYHLRLTRDLEQAKDYLRTRYAEDATARYGLVASSRDKALAGFGVPNDYWATDRVRKGPWFGNGEDDPTGQSCRFLTSCVTEFGCQGLELDAVLLAWGTDLICEDGAWTNRNAKRYQDPSQIRDPMQLRRNAYRVLLTRARDATVVFVPPLAILDETFRYLVGAGFRELETNG